MINWPLVMMVMSRIKVIKFRRRQIIFEDGNLGDGLVKWLSLTGPFRDILGEPRNATSVHWKAVHPLLCFLLLLNMSLESCEPLFASIPIQVEGLQTPHQIGSTLPSKEPFSIFMSERLWWNYIFVSYRRHLFLPSSFRLQKWCKQQRLHGFKRSIFSFSQLYLCSQ